MLIKVFGNFDLFQNIFSNIFSHHEIIFKNILVNKEFNNNINTYIDIYYRYEQKMLKSIYKKLNGFNPKIDFNVKSVEEFKNKNDNMMGKIKSLTFYNIPIDEFNENFYCDCGYCSYKIPCGNGIIDEFDFDEYEFLVKLLLNNYNWWANYLGYFAYNYYDKELYKIYINPQ